MLTLPYIKLAKLWGNYSHIDGQRLTNGQWFKECRRFTQRDIQPYGKCGYRYLHLSCHASSESIATTLDLIRFDELGTLLNPYLDGCRLFISACEAVNDQLARELIPASGCLSIIGPHEEVTFDEAATMWASFYQLMFRQNSRGMNREDIEPILEGLVGLFEVPVAYYGVSSMSRHGYRRQVFGA